MAAAIVGTKVTTLDPGMNYQTQSLSTAQPQSGYGPKYIRNRLLTSTVKVGTSSTATALVTNTYDQYTAAVCSSGVANQIADQSGIREHDSIYWAGFYNRGNLTTSTTPSGTRCLSYYITGIASGARDQYGHTTSLGTSSATNYVAPSTIMINGDSNSTTTNTFNAWMGLTSTVGPNAASAGMSYDSYGRPTRATSPYGAVTNYTYNHWCPVKCFAKAGKPLAINRIGGARPKNDLN